jgi:cobalt-zinc-cadmium efflux system membrane fusion protein
MNSRISTPARTASPRIWPALARYSNAVVGGVIVAAGVALLAAFWAGWIDILPYTSQVGGQPEGQEATAAPNFVELTPEKLAAAEIHLAAVERTQLQPTRPVPAEIEYDLEKRVPMNAPVEGVVLKVLVDPAQEVHKGQPLAILSCPEIGVARDLVEKRRADLKLAQREEQRAIDVSKHVDELLALLTQKPKLPAVESALDKRMLGEYREKIIGEYSKQLLAEHIFEASKSLEGGPLSPRLMEQRKAETEQARARFEGACESARFNAVQDMERAKAEEDRADRLLSVAQQALKNLLGPWAAMDEVSDPDHLNDLKLLAPIDGRIVERQAVQNARVEAAAPLFVVADTSVMWVRAEIHERDWRSLDFLKQGESLVVRVPALQNELLTAKILWTGAQVEAVRRSVPLTAALHNADDRLKPGMFAWALIPLDKPHESLVVPRGAIMRHENQPFVFVTDGERRFRRVDVELGLETNERIEIVSGLSAGDMVVDRGAFFLKSELLLEREE